ncbi:hypothetical protein [Yoonia sp. BS5-3]|uniref:Uncharacterized protein n=1 Tax=Yoonia phaeophyticola TaxID=3137369 RepID=A0ABZ3IDP1_9RHOB
MEEVKVTFIDFYAECSNSFESFIAGAFAFVVVAIIVLLAVLLSKKWLLGLTIVPPLYLFALEFSEFVFLALTLVTLGLPLLFCT